LRDLQRFFFTSWVLTAPDYECRDALHALAEFAHDEKRTTMLSKERWLGSPIGLIRPCPLHLTEQQDCCTNWSGRASTSIQTTQQSRDDTSTANHHAPPLKPRAEMTWGREILEGLRRR
jgi:hypothetical protein